ncbi:MAG: peptidoglycan-binding protein [Thermoanaerobacteraceae bacterium]|nr:peptidoglycan-binding protein [Thermoanaerobacteraceae bacterium]
MRGMRVLVTVVTLLVFSLSLGLPANAITFYFKVDRNGNVIRWQAPAGDVELTYGSYGERVRQLKQDLEKLGYRIGSTSKWFNYATQRAVMQLQRDNNLPVTGVADKKVFDLIAERLKRVERVRQGPEGKNDKFEFTEILQYGSSSDSVLQLETWLDMLGYDTGKVSRNFTVKTYWAVVQFQKDAGLAVTGRVDKATWECLRREAEVIKQPAPQPEQPEPQEPDPQEPRPEEPAQPQEPQQPQEPEPGQLPGTRQGDNNQPRQDQEQNQADSNLPAGLTADERRMIELVNQERINRGLEPLKVDMSLVETARLKSKDMVENNYFAHKSPIYGSPFDMMKAAGIKYTLAGENLAGAPWVELAHTNLMNSPGHRANILNPNFTHIGIGIVEGSQYGKIYTQLFIRK